jgi:hypothetical protein
VPVERLTFPITVVAAGALAGAASAVAIAMAAMPRPVLLPIFPIKLSSGVNTSAHHTERSAPRPSRRRLTVR